MSSTEKPLVLITGSSGLIGSHVLHQLLEAGYPVRATARPAKVDALKEIHKGKVDVVPIADLVAGDYAEALKGVGAIIHIASPLFGSAEPAKLIDGAVEGTMNIIRQATAAGVTKLIITSSIGSIMNFNTDNTFYNDIVVTDQDWNTATVEEALSGKYNDFWIYCAAKTAAEHAVRKFEDEHPEVDITTIHPTYTYGPFLPGTKIAKGDYGSLSTVDFFWKGVLPEGGSSIILDREPQFIGPINVDVRDAARAHVLALTAPPTSQVGRKRLIVSGPSMPWVDAVAHLRKAMPELADRLPIFFLIINRIKQVKSPQIASPIKNASVEAR